MRVHFLQSIRLMKLVGFIRVGYFSTFGHVFYMRGSKACRASLRVDDSIVINLCHEDANAIDSVS